MAHKGYHHMRQYRNEYRERRYEEKLGNLRQTTDDLLEDLRNTDHLLKDLQGGGEGSSRPSRLEALFQLYCRLLTVVSVLRGLQVGMLQQSENLDEWRSQGRDNETLELHQRQLKTATRELELKVEPLQSDLEIADKAVSAARLQMDKEHEKRERRVEKKEAIRQHRMQAVLAVVAAALGLPALVPILESFTGNAFVEFLAQFVRIASVVIVIALLAIPIWFLWRLIRPIMHRRLNRRRTNHEPKEAEIHVSEEK